MVLRRMSRGSTQIVYPRVMTSVGPYTVVYGLRGGELGFRVARCTVYGVKSCKLVFLEGALFIHLFRHFCCRVYRLVTMHSVTDRRTERAMTVSCQ